MISTKCIRSLIRLIPNLDLSTSTMSPILKRDVAETVRQARRFASAAGLANYDAYGEYELDPVSVSKKAKAAKAARGAGTWDDVEGASGSGRVSPSTALRDTPSFDDQRDRADDPLLHDDAASDTSNLTTMSVIEGKWSATKGLLLSVSCGVSRCDSLLCTRPERHRDHRQSGCIVAEKSTQHAFAHPLSS